MTIHVPAFEPSLVQKFSDLNDDALEVVIKHLDISSIAHRVKYLDFATFLARLPNPFVL